MHDLHNGCRENGVVLEDGLSLRVVNGIVANQKAGDELLYHEIAPIGRMGFQPGFQLRLVADFGGAAGAHSVVRLGDDGVSGLLYEGLDLSFSLGALDLPGRGNAAQSVVFLHFALVLDGGDVVVLDAGGYIEICPQAGILLQPVLVVGLNPVNFSVAVGIEGHSSVHFFVALQVVNFVVVRQVLPKLPGKVLVIGVRNAQDIDAIGPQAGAELPVGLRKMGGNEDEVHKAVGFILF